MPDRAARRSAPKGSHSGDRAAVVACYDEGVASNDAGVARLLGELERRGRVEDTLVVVVAEACKWWKKNLTY